MMVKVTVTALLILCHSICLAEDLPETKKNSRSWSAEKPAKMAPLETQSRSQSLETKPLLKIVSTNLDSPAVLDVGERFSVDVDYKNPGPGAVCIFMRPLSKGERLGSGFGNPSDAYSAGEGKKQVYFGLSAPGAVDAVRLTMVDANTQKQISTLDAPVDLKWKNITIEKQIGTLLLATMGNDLEKFNSVCNEAWKKEMTAEKLKKLSDQLYPWSIGGTGTARTFMGSVRHMTHRDYYWKILPKDSKYQGELLVHLTSQNGEVAGFFIHSSPSAIPANYPRKNESREK